MKIKSIISGGLLLLGVLSATTSCKDMFTPEEKLVATDLAPQDTLYQMMGIVKRMQKLADRTVLLGEIRADLVTVDANHAPADLIAMGLNDVTTDNVYNSPVDYYSVINNCNVYLAYVDSTLDMSGSFRKFEREISSVRCFRAWCYLELAKIYGEVPLVTEPVLTASAAEEIVNSDSKASTEDILNFCINDLQKININNNNLNLRQTYGDQQWNGIRYNEIFIPVRYLLGELYLWRGTVTGNVADYKKAIAYYHDYLCFPGEVHSAGDIYSRWMNEQHMMKSSSYYSRFDVGSDDNVGVLPCDTIAYYGNVSDLRSAFCSLQENNYYAWATPSQRVKDISAAQWYCYYNTKTGSITYMDHEPASYTGGSNEVGDIRFASVYGRESNITNTKYNSAYNTYADAIYKWTDGISIVGNKKNAYIPYSRVPIVYLHMAEALNRAGFPETAFAILAYGLTYETLTDVTRVSKSEFDQLKQISSVGITNVPEARYDSIGISSYSFVVWPSSFENRDFNKYSNSDGCPTDIKVKTQMGIHSFGSGHTEYNKKYFLDDSVTLAQLADTVAYPFIPTLNKKSTHEDSVMHDSLVDVKNKIIEDNKVVKADNAKYLASDEVKSKRMAHVAKLILDEEALEGMFEGHRFYDLMRYQRQEGKFNELSITLPDYIKKTYPTLEGGTEWTDNMTGKPWFLELPKR